MKTVKAKKARKETYDINKIANRVARAHGTNRATEIKMIGPLTIQLAAVRGEMEALTPRVIFYDRYHAESRTGIRASMAALKRYWHTYHYVGSVCVVAAPDRDGIYNDDTH